MISKPTAQSSLQTANGRTSHLKRGFTSPALAASISLQQAQPVQGIAYLSAMVALTYVILVYGRLPETFLRFPYVAAIVGAFGLMVSALSGSLLRAITFRSGQLLIGLTLWFIVCIPFSTWRGGSFELLTEIWLKSVALYLLVAGNITTFKQYRSICNAMVIAMITLLAASRHFGTNKDGRFALDLGTLGNPNDLASHLLIAVPFLFLAVELKGLKSVWSWAALGMAGTTLIVILKTGSRAGLLTLAILALYRFFRGSMKIKASFIVLALIALALAPIYVSRESMERYMVMLGRMKTQEATSRQVEFAEGSAETRMFLLQQSLVATVTRPLFGVGPGSFSTYVARKMENEGLRGNWAQTHNTFTQWSAECGLLGGLLFVMLVFRALQNGRFVWKLAGNNPDMKAYRAAGEALVAAVLCFVVSASFGNYAYMMYMPLLAGCGEALRASVTTETTVVVPPPPAPARRLPVPAS